MNKNELKQKGLELQATINFMVNNNVFEMDDRNIYNTHCPHCDSPVSIKRDGPKVTASCVKCGQIFPSTVVLFDLAHLLV